MYPIIKQPVFLLLLMIVLGCSSGQQEASDNFSIDAKPATPIKEKPKASTLVALENKGVGPISSVALSEDIDMVLHGSGKAAFEAKCTACHRLGERFVGPDLSGLLKRRSPEWVMNMMLDPNLMLKEDTLAQALFLEFNGSPMLDQGLTELEAREILEYLRNPDM